MAMKKKIGYTGTAGGDNPEAHHDPWVEMTTVLMEQAARDIREAGTGKEPMSANWTKLMIDEKCTFCSAVRFFFGRNGQSGKVFRLLAVNAGDAREAIEMLIRSRTDVTESRMKYALGLIEEFKAGG